MIENGPSFNPHKLERMSRKNIIAAIGALPFKSELGPNSRTPENGPEILEPGVIVTNDEAAYIAGTLGSLIER
jgi:hypothetical protein